MISTQDELPPKVWEPAKSSSRSRKAAACSGVSSLRPEARIRAETSLRRTSVDVMATGIEPRVPQNLTLKCPSGGIECRQCLRGEPCEPLPDRREYVENHREAADVEDLSDRGLQCGHAERASLGLGLLGGQHEHAQPHAADVLHTGEVEDHAVLTLGAASHVGGERGLEVFRGGMVDAAHWGQHHRVHIAFRRQLHVSSMEWPAVQVSMLSPAQSEPGILPVQGRSPGGAGLTRPAGSAHYRRGGADLAAIEGT